MDAQALKWKLRKMMKKLRPVTAEAMPSRRIEGYISTAYEEQPYGNIGILVDAELAEDVVEKMLATLSRIFVANRMLLANGCKYMLYAWTAEKIVGIGRPAKRRYPLEERCHEYAEWGQPSTDLVTFGHSYHQAHLGSRHEILFLLTTFDKLNDAKKTPFLLKKNTIALYPAGDATPEFVGLHSFPAYCMSMEESVTDEKGM